MGAACMAELQATSYRICKALGCCRMSLSTWGHLGDTPGTHTLQFPIQYLGSASSGFFQAIAAYCRMVQLCFTGTPLGVQQVLFMCRSL